MSREETLNALASAMGVGVFGKTEMEESRYDPETGTLYCNGNIIPKNVMDDAMQYLVMMQKGYNGADAESRKMFLIYLAAIEGLKGLKKEREEKGKR